MTGPRELLLKGGAQETPEGRILIPPVHSSGGPWKALPSPWPFSTGRGNRPLDLGGRRSYFCAPGPTVVPDRSAERRAQALGPGGHGPCGPVGPGGWTIWIS